MISDGDFTRRLVQTIAAVIRRSATLPTAAILAAFIDEFTAHAEPTS